MGRAWELGLPRSRQGQLPTEIGPVAPRVALRTPATQVRLVAARHTGPKLLPPARAHSAVRTLPSNTRVADTVQWPTGRMDPSQLVWLVNEFEQLAQRALRHGRRDIGVAATRLVVSKTLKRDICVTFGPLRIRPRRP